MKQTFEFRSGGRIAPNKPFFLIVVALLGLLIATESIDSFRLKGKQVKMPEDEWALIFGGAFVLLALFGMYSLFKRAPKKGAAFEINDKGIIDNTSAMSAGVILWNDIIDIHPRQVGKKVYFDLKVRKPEQYIERAQGSLTRFEMKGNLKKFGTPVQISPENADVDPEKLLNLIVLEIKRRQAK